MRPMQNAESATAHHRTINWASAGEIPYLRDHVISLYHDWPADSQSFYGVNLQTPIKQVQLNDEGTVSVAWGILYEN